MNKRVISVGIISYEEYKWRTMAIAQGAYRPKPGESKIWFESLETMVKVFNSKNQQLLRIILAQQHSLPPFPPSFFEEIFLTL